MENPGIRFGFVGQNHVDAFRGLAVLGISDHTALPDNRWPHIRMDIGELPGYIRAVDEAMIDTLALNPIVLLNIAMPGGEVYYAKAKGIQHDAVPAR